MSKPVFSIKVGAISVAVWENTTTVEGKSFTSQNITVNRTYKDKDEWKQTSSLRFQDLPLVATAINKLMEWKYLTVEEKDNPEF